MISNWQSPSAPSCYWDAHDYHEAFCCCLRASVAGPVRTSSCSLSACIKATPDGRCSHCSSDCLPDALPAVQLEDMRAADPTAKALVFSQFNSTIDWLKVKLGEHGFGFRTISGGMTLSKRTKVRASNLCPAAPSCARRACLMASLFFELACSSHLSPC